MTYRLLLLAMSLALSCAGMHAQSYTAATITNGYAANSIVSTGTIRNGNFVPTGTLFGALDEGVASNIPIGFSFDFFGTAYTALNINSNGLVSFSPITIDIYQDGAGGATGTYNYVLPSTGQPDNFIAIAWEDYDLAISGTVYTQTLGTAPNRRFVCQFVNAAHFTYAEQNTVLMVLYETTNVIEIHFSTSTSWAQVGIEDANGVEGLQAPGGWLKGPVVSTDAFSFTPTTAAASIDIQNTTLPNATETQAYSTNIVAIENGTTGPYTWGLTGAPGWLGISGTGLTATLSGTPPAGAAASGPYNFNITVQATSGENDSQAVTLVVTAGAAAYVDILTTTLPNATELVAYTTSVSAAQSGTTSPYIWGLTGAPAWLGISGTGLTATLSGTPPAATTGQTFNFSITVQATSGESDSQAVSLTVDPATGTPVINITTTTLAAATEQVLYNANILASQSNTTGPYTWSIVGGTPAWLSISGTGLTGALSGTPPAASAPSVNFSVTVTAASGQSDTQAYTLTINAAGTLAIVTNTLPGGNVGAGYTGTITASGGTGPYTWSIASGNPPIGLTLDTTATGLTVGFTGTPTTGQTANFTVMVTDSTAALATRALSITITAGGGGGFSGGGGGGGGGGCASGTGTTWTVVLLFAAVGALALRRRRLNA